METLKRHITTLSRACLYLVAVVLMASGLVGCDVHEYPEIPKEPFELRLHFETAMPTYQELEINTYSRAEQYDIRYTVNVYLAEASIWHCWFFAVYARHGIAFRFFAQK